MNREDILKMNVKELLNKMEEVFNVFDKKLNHLTSYRVEEKIKEMHLEQRYQYKLYWGVLNIEEPYDLGLFTLLHSLPKD
jgi:uncharacterized SAM-dependent methyltransferase